MSVADNLIMSDVWYKSGRPAKALIYARKVALDNSFSRVAIVGTVLTTLLYMLIFDDWRDTCFIVSGGLTRDVADKLVKHGARACYPTIFTSSRDSDRKVFNELAEYVRENKIPVYGHDHLKSFSEAFVDENFSVIEDGVGNYRAKVPNLRRKLSDGTSYIPYGYDKLIKCVYLTGRMPIPDALKDKARVFDMTEYWRKKTPEEQSVIEDIFSVPIQEIVSLFEQGKNQIFLTQPLYEVQRGDFATRKRKVVAFYKKVLERYDKSRILIKVHPRDRINYKRYFPNYTIMTDKFPMEFFKLLGFADKIDRVISVHCTANYGVVDEDKVDEYRKEWSKFIKTGDF